MPKGRQIYKEDAERNVRQKTIGEKKEKKINERIWFLKISGQNGKI